jgi:FAD:protein FMN transferase
LPLSGQGLATSGRSRRSLLVAGQQHSLVLDPRTGQSVTRTLSASVLAPDAASADALATILSVLPPPQGLALAEGLPGVAALITTPQRQVWTTQSWPGAVPGRHTQADWPAPSTSTSRSITPPPSSPPSGV